MSDLVAGSAEPMPRLGTYRIEEQPGANPLGMAVSGDALATYWRELVVYCVGKSQRRDAAAGEIDAAYGRGDGAAAGSIQRWRYGQKIEIKSAEAVAELLHGIVAPDAPFLCDDRCQHVLGGASPEQVKRFLDSVDVKVSALREEWHRCRAGHPCYEDLQDEFGMYGRWRERLVQAAAPEP